MKRSVWICRDRCGDKSRQLFTCEPSNEGGEWFSYINGTSEPGRPTNVYLPPNVAFFLTGRPRAKRWRFRSTGQLKSCRPIEGFAELALFGRVPEGISNVRGSRI